MAALGINNPEQQNLQIADSYHDFYNNMIRVTDSTPAHRVIKHSLNNVVINWGNTNGRFRAALENIDDPNFPNTDNMLHALFNNNTIHVAAIEHTTAAALGCPESHTIHYPMNQLDAPGVGEAFGRARLAELLQFFNIPNDNTPVFLICDAGNSVLGAMANHSDTRIRLIITPQTFADSATTTSDRSQSPMGKDKPWKRARINHPPEYFFPINNNTNDGFISNGNLFTRGLFSINYTNLPGSTFDGQNTAFNYSISNTNGQNVVIPYNQITTQGFKTQGPSVKLLAANILTASGWVANDPRDTRYNIQRIKQAKKKNVVDIEDYLPITPGNPLLLESLLFDIKRCGDRDQAESAIILSRMQPQAHIIYSAGDLLSAVIAAKHGIKTIYQRVHGNDGIITLYNGIHSQVQPPLFQGGGKSSNGSGKEDGESNDDSYIYGTLSGELDKIAELSYEINNFLRNFIVNNSNPIGKQFYNEFKRQEKNPNTIAQIRDLFLSDILIAYYGMIIEDIKLDTTLLPDSYNLFKSIIDNKQAIVSALLAYGLLYDRFSNSTMNRSILSWAFYENNSDARFISPPLNGTTVDLYSQFLAKTFSNFVTNNSLQFNLPALSLQQYDNSKMPQASMQFNLPPSTPPRAGSHGFYGGIRRSRRYHKKTQRKMRAHKKRRATRSKK